MSARAIAVLGVELALSCLALIWVLRYLYSDAFCVAMRAHVEADILRRQLLGEREPVDGDKWLEDAVLRARIAIIWLWLGLTITAILITVGILW